MPNGCFPTKCIDEKLQSVASGQSCKGITVFSCISVACPFYIVVSIREHEKCIIWPFTGFKSLVNHEWLHETVCHNVLWATNQMVEHVGQCLEITYHTRNPFGMAKGIGFILQYRTIGCLVWYPITYIHSCVLFPCRTFVWGTHSMYHSVDDPRGLFNRCSRGAVR